MSSITLPTWYYEQFDADPGRDVPAEGYGGWKRADLELAPEHTALAVMHAWDCGTRASFPGLHRATEYIPRADDICRTVFPRLLAAVRASPLRVVHIADASYACRYEGYGTVAAAAGPEPATPPHAALDPVTARLRDFRQKRVFPGERNTTDVQRWWDGVDFPAEATPLPGEPIAATTHQLAAFCRTHEIHHLIYAGFAINWCLLLLPGGMMEMAKYGVMCSALRQAVTAVENKESARLESHKEEALWRVAVAFGFVYDVDDLVTSLPARGRTA
jgi:hypothetical protein